MDSITLTIIIMVLLFLGLLAWVFKQVNEEALVLVNPTDRRSFKCQVGGYGVIVLVVLLAAVLRSKYWSILLSICLVVHTILFSRARYVPMIRTGMPVDGIMALVSRGYQVLLALLFLAFYFLNGQ